jgi:hypothetical protein
MAYTFLSPLALSVWGEERSGISKNKNRHFSFWQGWNQGSLNKDEDRTHLINHGMVHYCRPTILRALVWGQCHAWLPCLTILSWSRWSDCRFARSQTGDQGCSLWFSWNILVQHVRDQDRPWNPCGKDWGHRGCQDRKHPCSWSQPTELNWPSKGHGTGCALVWLEQWAHDLWLHWSALIPQ